MEQVHKHITRFLKMLRDEEGAITVDWIVMTAAVVMMGMAAAFAVGANIPGLANQVSKVVSEQPVGG